MMAYAARRPIAIAAFVAAALALGGALILHGPHNGPAELHSQVIESGPFTSTIAVVGSIVPDQSVAVTSPLVGTVKRVTFEYGVPVVRGQILAEVDDTDARQRRDEARSAYLKAWQAAGEMAVWAHGPDVSRDRRAAEAAAYDLGNTRRKVAETKRLLDRGLVARDEYEADLEQEHSQELALASARQDLAATVERGRGADRQVVGLELRDAHDQLAQLDGEVAGAIIRAPSDGVIVRPPVDKEAAAAQIHVGQQLAKGQLIGSIADTGGLAVVFQLNETDADAVRPGQAVSVTGPGFGDYVIQGHVVSVAGEASPYTPGQPATFPATARLDPLTPAKARTVRIGMTANVVIAVYTAATALVAPPAAIQGAAPDAFVTVKDPRNGKVRAVRVQLGHVSPDGVEVLSGLKAGNTVVWSTPANSASK